MDGCLENSFCHQASGTLWLKEKYPKFAFQVYLENFWKNFEMRRWIPWKYSVSSTFLSDMIPSFSEVNCVSSIDKNQSDSNSFCRFVISIKILLNKLKLEETCTTHHGIAKIFNVIPEIYVYCCASESAGNLWKYKCSESTIWHFKYLGCGIREKSMFLSSL